MRCPLCSYEFDEKQMSCHASCAFNEQCAIICCPNCGYQVVDTTRSKLAQALQRLLSSKGNASDAPAPVYPLSALQAGQSGTITSVETSSTSRLERLSVLGLVSGARVTLEQKRPTFVLRVGFTELSLERELAEEIFVEV
jgi:Fe2+ transport system protein FeoA